MSHHKLTSYRASLIEVLKAQVKSQRLEPGLQGVLDLVESVALKVRHVTKYNISIRVTVQGFCYVVWRLCYLIAPFACHVLSHDDQC